jgi:hypothetical protein
MRERLSGHSPFQHSFMINDNLERNTLQQYNSPMVKYGVPMPSQICYTPDRYYSSTKKDSC